MPLHLPLHLAANRRKRTPAFGAATRAAAAALSRRSTEPLAGVLRARTCTHDDVLFAASIHGVAGLLSKLADEGGGELPDALASSLREARERARLRGERIAADVARLARLAESRSLPFVPLKGAYLASALYSDVSLRPSADVDLLATGAAFGDWCRVLEEDGYTAAGTSYKHREYVRSGERPTGSGYLEDAENPVPVEVHPHLVERLLGGRRDITGAYVRGLVDGTLGGAPARVPGPAALALHLFLHTAPAAFGRGERLVHLYDLRFLPDDAALGATLGAELGALAWGVAVLAERALPGCLGPNLLAALEPFAPADARRGAFLSRPGVTTGEEEKTLLVLTDLRLCATKREQLGRLVQVLPDRAYLASTYGGTGALAPFRGLALYYRDRFR